MTSSKTPTTPTTPSTQDTPRFQQLQQRMTQAIRDPEQHAYHTEDLAGAPIEARRIQVYQSLLLNNLEQLFSQVFPVSRSLLGELIWADLVAEFLKRHHAKTPLFHRLGQEWIQFLHTHIDSEWLAKQLHSLHPLKPLALLELAHYEWTELDLFTQPLATNIVSELNPLNTLNAVNSKADVMPSDAYFWSKQYQLSPEVRPLAYEWPVHQLSKENRPSLPEATFLLAQRRVLSNEQLNIDFHQITPVLHCFLSAFSDKPLDAQINTQAWQPVAKKTGSALQEVADWLEIDAELLREGLKKTLPALIAQGWLTPVKEKV